MSSRHELEKHNEWWRGSADKEGNLDVKYKKVSLDMMFRNNILYNTMGKAIKIWKKNIVEMKAALRWKQIRPFEGLLYFYLLKTNDSFFQSIEWFSSYMCLHSIACLQSGDIILMPGYPGIERFFIIKK